MMLTMEGVPKNERQDKFGFRFGRSTLRGDTLSPITDEVPLLTRPPRPLVPHTAPSGPTSSSVGVKNQSCR